LADLHPPRRRRGCRWSVALVVALAAVVALPETGRADAEDDFELARNLFRDAGDYATSAQLFAEFLRNYPGDTRDAQARLMLARSYARSQRCGEAVPAYEGFTERYPDHIEASAARRERAGCLQQLGNFDRAATAFEEVQRLYSEGQFAAGSLLSAALNYARAGDLANAVRAYDKLLADYDGTPESLRGRYRLAQLRFARGDAAGAQALLTQITSRAPRSEAARDALLLSGNMHLVLQQTAAATGAFERLHDGFPASAQSDSAWLDLASHHLAQRAWDEAGRVYGRAIDAIDDEAMKARARLGRADAWRGAGEPARALEIYRALTDPASPVRGEALLGQAIALGQTGRVGAAVGLFLQLAQSPSVGAPSAVAVGAERELGALYRRQGDLARASSWFRRYLDDAERFGADFPESTAEQDLVRLQLAQVLDASGYHDQAVRLFSDLSRSPGALASEAQYGLAAAYEASGARRLAIGEYAAFLERWPGHTRAAQVRQRVEYLREYTIVDPARMAAALQQAWIDELSGTSRQSTRLRVAQILREHQDYANAARAWETYVASYPGDVGGGEAQFYLADCLYRLSRQRQLEGAATAADSLHRLALQEDRILADGEHGRWSRLARLRLIESTAAVAAADTARTRVLEEGYVAFLGDHPPGPEVAEARARALLGLADVRREVAGQDSARLTSADGAYSILLRESPASPLAPRARFGRALVALERGRTAAGIDSLSALLPALSGSAQQADVLAALGEALADAGRHAEAATRLGELLLAFPDYEGRRRAQERLADTYLAIGDAARAAELFEALAAGDAGGDVDGSLRRRLARARLGEGDAGAALAIYDRLLAEKVGATDSLHVARGRVLARLNRVDEAIEAFAQIRRGPLLPAAQRGAADLQFARSDFAAAAAAYAPLTEGEVLDAAGLGRAVAALYETGKAKEAERLADRHRKRFGKEGVWPYLFRLYEGRALLALKEFDKARDRFEDVARDAARKPASLDLGEAAPVMMRRMAADPAAAGAFFAVTARWEKMRAEPTEEGTAEALQAQGNYAKEHPESPFIADVHMRLAAFHMALGNLRMAAGAYSRVVDGAQATATQRQEAIWQLLDCRKRLYEWDEALRVARRLQAEFPEHPRAADVQLDIGYILIEMGQYGPAISFLEKVLEWAEGEDAAGARFHIGKAYQKTGDYRRAIQHFYQVAFYGADASTQWITTADYERARCYAELGEVEQARSVYERIIQREGGSSEWGRFARAELDRLPAPGN
jgi:TolA-binding protein